MAFEKATRKKAKLKLALTGSSGSGKTYSALQIAKGIGNKIALIDTENQSASLYSNLVDFDTLCLTAPFEPEKYIQAIKEAEKAGYDVLIIDSITHEWSGKGGILEIVDNVAKASASKNSYFAWGSATPRHNAFIDAILQSPIHIIVTMRSKQDFVLVDKGGKQVPQKVGLAPIQREGFEYEMTVVLDISIEHIASASKDRTGLFTNFAGQITEETGKQLKEWLELGIEAPKPFDWSAWAKEYAAKIKECKTAQFVDELVKQNATKMNELSKALPDWHSRLVQVINSKREELSAVKEAAE